MMMINAIKNFTEEEFRIQNSEWILSDGYVALPKYWMENRGLEQAILNARVRS